MDFNNVIDATVLNERYVADIVKDWAGPGGFREKYTEILKAKSQNAANAWAEKWLGNVHDFKGIQDLKTRLQKAEKYMDSDETLLKVVNVLVVKQKEAELEMAKKSHELATRKKEIAGDTLVS
jgi:hypothetical protein